MMYLFLPTLSISFTAAFNSNTRRLWRVPSEITRSNSSYPFGDDEFDLVISLGTLHNLRVFELKAAVKEIERVGKNKYIMVEGYRNELELFNLECWALTAESLFHTSEWIWLYNRFGYTGDYEFIYFE